ncbi:MAG: hypothetical protein AAFX86_03485 [Pseudomonadota bacterium]
MFSPNRSAKAVSEAMPALSAERDARAPNAVDTVFNAIPVPAGRDETANERRRWRKARARRYAG